MKNSDISEANTIHCGFIPLVDCAILVVARELGIDKEHDIFLKLHREVSWANIRDRVNLGHYDCAHMLAGMPIAGSLGIGHIKEEIIAPFALGRGGNAITLSHEIFAQMCEVDEGLALAGGMQAARALSQVLKKRSANNQEPLTLGMVYPFSCHNYDLRYWLASAGINPETDVRLVVIPPSLIAESLEAGHVQGFCVGEPWNSFAVDKGYGRIIATKGELWSHAPEKVLGVRKSWADQEQSKLFALIQTLHKSAKWLRDEANLLQAAKLMAKAEYVDISQELILRALTGQLVLQKPSEVREYDNFLEFYDDYANFPFHSHAIWLMTQMVRWGQLSGETPIRDIARKVYRPDLYREALKDIAVDMPNNDLQIEDASINQNFFGGSSFNANKVSDYIASLKNNIA